MTASQRRLAEKILEPLEWQGAWISCTISAMDARNIEWKNNTRYVSVMYMRSDLEKEAMRIAIFPARA